MEWKVSNALSRDIERQQLNKVLADIQAAVNKLSTATSSSTAFPDIGGGGISSSYNPSTGSVELSVPDFTINLDGNVTGSGTVSKLSSVTIPTVLDPSLIGVEEAPIDNQYYWRINEAWDVVPDSIISIADLDQEGIAVLWENPDTYTFEWIMREIEGTSDQIDVINGNGVAGNPILNLSDLTDSGVGTFKLLTRDVKGRLEGTEDGEAVDVPYDNTTSGLTATDVQAALDELKTMIGSSGGGGGLALVGEYVVAGAAATDMTVSGLDLSADSMYYIILNIGNAIASDATLSLFFNGDTTTTHYYYQFWVADGAGSSSSRTNTATLSGLSASSSLNGVVELIPDILGSYPRSVIRLQRKAPSGIELVNAAHIRNDGANVTSITISSSVASSISVGSYIKVYKIIKDATSGSSFPASPSTNQRFFRTDLGLDCFYDGTRWLTVTSYELSAAPVESSGLPGSSTTAVPRSRWPVRQDFGLYLEKLVCATFINGTNNISNYWSISLQRFTSLSVATTITSFNTSADSGTTYVNHDTSIDAVLDASAITLNIIAEKIGAPGGIYCMPSLVYRLIVT